ncbi:hypothetical protein DM40_2540 [Burkholderia cenocepacia]|nr:hypothetical protein DM40_2540 [Burkholderia cenocepacia]
MLNRTMLMRNIAPASGLQIIESGRETRLHESDLDSVGRLHALGILFIENGASVTLTMISPVCFP